ncbi:DUF3866 family protein [Paenibacillus ginsengarvi]|nr:DUF3866 family protein [Paenibacillus ginsengarvi]
MIVWSRGTVVGITGENGSVQEVEVLADDGSGTRKAIHYTDVRPSLRLGDHVVLNVTAEELGLDGGVGFVHDVLPASDALQMTSGGTDKEPDVQTEDDSGGTRLSGYAVSSGQRGHIVKLRFTAAQRAVLSVEEKSSPHHDVFAEPRGLDGMPVLIGELHSMLPVAAAWLRGAETKRPLRLSYVMTDGAALPLAYSRHAARLRREGFLDGMVTCGHAYGGELEAVNVYTALLAARHIQRADIVIAAMGPGIVGTGTPFGHTGTELAELIHAAAALGGVPIAIARVSFADTRERHIGISHHSLETLGKLTLVRSTVALPAGLPEPQEALLRRQWEASGCAERHELVWEPAAGPAEAERRLAAYREPVTTMGRGLRDDPAFFCSVCAAAQQALSRHRPRE